jgi:hypothetical protein
VCQKSSERNNDASLPPAAAPSPPTPLPFSLSFVIHLCIYVLPVGKAFRVVDLTNSYWHSTTMRYIIWKSADSDDKHPCLLPVPVPEYNLVKPSWYLCLLIVDFIYLMLISLCLFFSVCRKTETEERARSNGGGMGQSSASRQLDALACQIIH